MRPSIGQRLIGEGPYLNWNNEPSICHLLARQLSKVNAGHRGQACPKSLLESGTGRPPQASKGVRSGAHNQKAVCSDK